MKSLSALLCLAALFAVAPAEQGVTNRLEPFAVPAEVNPVLPGRRV